MLDPILQILVQNGYIDEESAKDLQEIAKTEAKPVRKLVIDQEIVTEDDLLAAMAAYQDTEMIDLGAGKAGDKVIFLKRKRLVENIPTVLVDAYLVYNKFAHLMDADLVNNSLRAMMDADPETRVYRMLRIIEAVPATKEDIKELDVEPGSAIQKMTTIRFNEKGEVLDMAYAYHRGDMNRIELEILNPEKEI